MPKSAIDDSLWTEMTAAQKSDAVRAGGATLRQTVEGLLDGPDELSRVCKEVLTRADASLKELTDAQLPNGACPDGDTSDNSIDYQGEQQDREKIKASEPIQQQATSDSTNQGR